MTTQRLFVGNLPQNVTEADLRQEFGAYGTVRSIDLKIKQSTINDDGPNKFAFINIEIDDHMVRQCIQEFKNIPYQGVRLNVSVARESFLEKLKRERDEAAEENTKQSTSFNVKSQADKIESDEFVIRQSIHKFTNQQATNLDSDDCFLIKKRNQGAFMEKGKLKIIGPSGTGLSALLETNENMEKALDPKAKQSDEKRLESLNKMKAVYNQQRFAIKTALSRVDNSGHKKIIFDETGQPVSENPKIHRGSQERQNLFNEDDEDDFKNDFSIREQFEGAKGQKLLELLTKFKNDKRFAMSSKFQDDLDNEAELSNHQKETSNERRQQLDILGSVVGKKFQDNYDHNRPKIHQTMLRFDPTKKDHKKFVKDIHTEGPELPMDVNEDYYQEQGPDVSSEKFYKVSDRFGQALQGNENQGFSLLGMLGRNSAAEGYGTHQEVYETIPLTSKGNKRGFSENPFKYDSSDEEGKSKVSQTKLQKPVKQHKQSTSIAGKTNKRGVFRENFFILSGDARLEEGMSFFLPIQKAGDSRDFYEVRQELKKIVSKKVKKNLLMKQKKFGKRINMNNKKKGMKRKFVKK